MTQEHTGGEEFKSDIRIADDVIGYIAVLAAMDVEGVEGIVGVKGTETASVISNSKNIKGIKTHVEGEEVRFSIAVIAKYGCSLPKLSAAVQEKIKSTVENMTGFTVSETDVLIAGIDVPENV